MHCGEKRVVREQELKLFLARVLGGRREIWMKRWQSYLNLYDSDADIY